MKRRIGLLTSGGDCPGLNAVIRGVAKAAYQNIDDVEIIGIQDGFLGLINGEYKEMKERDFSGILTLGGTILGTSRQPYSAMQVISDDVDKVANMKSNYKKMKLDCLLILGGNGTHKSANLLAQEGLNVIGLPKTIDNDIWGTDVTFGFHTAVDIATDVVDRIHTTAASHGRVMVIEIMGNKAGWLTLYAGIAGGADIILLPEIPFSMDAVVDAVLRRAKQNKDFSIVCVAEGAMTKDESSMKRKERLQKRTNKGYLNVCDMIAKEIQDSAKIETRTVLPGHIQRGGSPSAYDRLLSTRFGTYAAQLLKNECYGVSVALLNGTIMHNPLSAVAGKTKLVPPDHQIVNVAREIGISFGE